MMGRISLLPLLLVMLTGCISIGVKNKDITPSHGVSFSAPPGNFKRLDTETADASWINKKTGTIISFQSSCNEASDPSKEAMLNNATSGIQDKEILSEKAFSYNGREALRRTLQGELDGVKMHLDLIALKKNKCNYIISYVGLPKEIKNSQHAFEEFLKEFEAP